MESNKNNNTTGIIYGLFAYMLWGFLPLYWKFLIKVQPVEIIAHRILWSFVFVSILVLVTRQWDKIINSIKNKKNIILIICCSILITINWFTYIWAVNSNHIVESSLGYYINPLILVLFGKVILKEKLDLLKIVSLIFASVGVILMTVQYGKIPWIALILAVSFGLYGLVKKLLAAESIVSLTLETAILAPFALIFIIIRQNSGIGAFGTVSIPVTILLVCAGVATATPLLWFAKAARRVELNTLGFLQYISPTIGLILGIFVYKEAFTTIDLICFSFIWVALVIYSLSQTVLLKYLPGISQKT